MICKWYRKYHSVSNDSITNHLLNFNGQDVKNECLVIGKLALILR